MLLFSIILHDVGHGGDEKICWGGGGGGVMALCGVWPSSGGELAIMQLKARATLVFRSARPKKKYELGRGYWYLLPVKFRRILFSNLLQRSRTELSQSVARAAILVFKLARKTKLVEDVEILLPTKIHWIPLSDCREEVENVSANWRPLRPSWFSDQPEKHKLYIGRSYLASCQVSLNSVLEFQKKSRKCLS